LVDFAQSSRGRIRGASRWPVWLALVCACVAGWYVWRSALRPHPPLDPLSRTALADRGASVFARVSVSNIADPAVLQEGVQKAQMQGERVTPEEASTLRRDLAQFLVMRFTEPRADAYAAWRMSQGLSFQSKQTMVSVWSIDASYPEVLRKPWDPAMEVPDAFAEFYENTFRTDRFCMPTGICLDAQGCEIAIGDWERVNGVAPSIGMRPDSVVVDELWHGGVGVTMAPWFNAGARREEILKHAPSVRFATAAFVVEFRGQVRMPMILGLFRDPRNGMWIVDRLNFNNYPEGVQFINLDF
jgi:hypothetical protein